MCNRFVSLLGLGGAQAPLFFWSLADPSIPSRFPAQGAARFDLCQEPMTREGYPPAEQCGESGREPFAMAGVHRFFPSVEVKDVNAIDL